MAYLEVSNVTYRYPLTTANAIENINFKLDKGQVLGIMGVNGSGKTTICNILRGFIPSFYQGTLQGSVKIAGKSLKEYPDTELSQLMGYIFQNPFTQISGVKDTVKEELGYALENMGTKSETIKVRVQQIIELLGLQQLANKNPFALSGGQKQMVAIGSILVTNPDILIFDEPTSQLDPAASQKIFELIGQLKKQGKTIVLVEHKIDMMMNYVDRLLLLTGNGQQLDYGEPRHIFTNRDVINVLGNGLPTAVRINLAQLRKKHAALPDVMPVTQEEIIEQLKSEEGR